MALMDRQWPKGPLTKRQRDMIRRLRAEGMTGPQVAEVVGCTEQTVRIHAPGRPNNVPVEPLREAVQASNVALRDIAMRLGWWERDHPDTTRVRRTLGMLPDAGNKRTRSLRRSIHIDTAERIADAIGVGPYELWPDRY